MQHPYSAYLFVLALTVWTACEASESGTDDDGNNDNAGDSDTTDGAVLFNRCAQTDLIGGFEATVLADYSGVQGAVANAVLPASIAAKKYEDGTCILWKPPTLTCDPPCSPEEACVFDDTGQGLVTAGSVDALIEAGVSGFPSGRLTRTTIDSVQVDAGCVELAVESPRTVEVSISGYIPCKGPDDCPEGMVCNPKTFLCEEQ